MPKVHLMKFLRPGSRLRALVQAGMGAFANIDVKLIAEDQRPRIGDSLDLDSASRDECPQEHRWDYIVSVPDRKELAGIEPHRARDSEISVVVAKKKQAIACLRSHLQNDCRVARWYWVSPGTVSFSRMDRARRRLDQNGIAFVGRVLRDFG